MTPILPYSIWKYNEEIISVITSYVDVDGMWNILAINRKEEQFKIIITCEDWLKRALYIGEI